MKNEEKDLKLIDINIENDGQERLYCIESNSFMSNLIIFFSYVGIAFFSFAVGLNGPKRIIFEDSKTRSIQIHQKATLQNSWIISPEYHSFYLYLGFPRQVKENTFISFDYNISFKQKNHEIRVVTKHFEQNISNSTIIPFILNEYSSEYDFIDVYILFENYNNLHQYNFIFAHGNPDYYKFTFLIWMTLIILILMIIVFYKISLSSFQKKHNSENFDVHPPFIQTLCLSFLIISFFALDPIYFLTLFKSSRFLDQLEKLFHLVGEIYYGLFFLYLFDDFRLRNNRIRSYFHLPKLIFAFIQYIIKSFYYLNPYSSQNSIFACISVCFDLILFICITIIFLIGVIHSGTTRLVWFIQYIFFIFCFVQIFVSSYLIYIFPNNSQFILSSFEYLMKNSTYVFCSVYMTLFYWNISKQESIPYEDNLSDQTSDIGLIDENNEE